MAEDTSVSKNKKIERLWLILSPKSDVLLLFS